MKISIYKTKEGDYTTNANNASEFLFEVELGQKFYCVALYEMFSRTVLDYNADPDKWNHNKLLEEAYNALQSDLVYGYESYDDEDFEDEFVCTMFECEVDEYETGRYAVMLTPIRNAKVTYNEER